MHTYIHAYIHCLAQSYEVPYCQIRDLHKHKCSLVHGRYTHKNWIYISFSNANKLAQIKNIFSDSQCMKNEEFWFGYVQIYLTKTKPMSKILKTEVLWMLYVRKANW